MPVTLNSCMLCAYVLVSRQDSKDTLVVVSLPTDTTATDFSVRVLSNICRDDSANEANAKATDEPANVELGKARSADGAAGLYDRTH